MRTQQDEIQRDLEQVLEHYGVESFIVVWRNPDSEGVRSMSNGDAHWRLGILDHLCDVERSELKRCARPA